MTRYLTRRRIMARMGARDTAGEVGWLIGLLALALVAMRVWR